jgi:hypothetical protein
MFSSRLVSVMVDAKGNVWADSNGETTRLIYQHERHAPNI